MASPQTSALARALAQTPYPIHDAVKRGDLEKLRALLADATYDDINRYIRTGT